MKLLRETITPAKARVYLEGNTINRPLSSKHIDYLASEIRGGRWQVNGEAIKFNGTRLLDGQHRLHAIIKAGQPITSLVVRGLSPDCFQTIDSGKKRSAADTLNIAGEKSATHLAAALARVEALEAGQHRNTQAVSGAKALALLEKHPEIRQSLSAFQGPKTLLTPSIAIALHYLFARKDRALADQFFHDLRSGAGLSEGDPVFTLREKLIGNTVGNSRLKDEAILACTIKAWNGLRRGMQIKLLRYRPGSEAFPVIL